MLIDYSRILNNDIREISQERLEEIKARATAAREAIKYKCHDESEVAEYMSPHAEEYAYIKAVNRDLSDDEKNILSANIMLTNRKLADILQNSGYQYKKLKAFIDIVTYIKRELAEGKSSEEHLEKYINASEKFTKKLLTTFRKQIGKITSSQIINKLYEVMAYEPELLKSKEERFADAKENLQKLFEDENNTPIELMYYYADTDEKEIYINVIINDDTINNKADILSTVIKALEAFRERYTELGVKMHFSIRNSGTYSLANIDVDNVIFASEKATRGVKR